MNTSEDPIELTIDLSASKSMFTVPTSGKHTVVIQPGETELLGHLVADPNADSFVRKMNVTHRSL